MGEHQILTEIRERLVRVETKIDDMTNVKQIANEAKETANEANASSKSAHKRLDKIDKVFFWAGTSIIGFIILTALKILFTGGN